MKFVILKSVTKEWKDKVENKKVCEVTEHHLNSPLGPYKGWVGSFDLEYFSVTFARGVIGVSVTEREMCLGWELVNFAVVEHLHNTIYGKLPVIEKGKLVDEYNKTGYLKDVDEVAFEDIMKVFKWKFKSRKVKVQYPVA